VTSFAEDAKVIDPVTQRKVLPMVAAFSAAASDRSLTLFIDFAGDAGKLFSVDDEKIADYMYHEMLSQLRQQKGLFCLVTRTLKNSNHPIEFHQVINLSYPPEELQMICWEEHIGRGNTSDDALANMVEQYPMHIEEIKFIARQATVRSIMRNGSTTPDMKCVVEVVSGYRRKVVAPILFGGG
jgi:hypothetical protein